MTETISIFVAQYSLIFLLGIQSLNVNSKRYKTAFVTSLCLGIVGFHVTGTVAAAYRDGMFTPIWWSFIFAGPLGIVSSMKLHPVIVRFFK